MISLDTALTTARETLATVTERAEQNGYYSGGAQRSLTRTPSSGAPWVCSSKRPKPPARCHPALPAHDETISVTSINRMLSSAYIRWVSGTIQASWILLDGAKE